MWFGNDPIMSLFCVMNLYGISKVCISLKFSTIIRRLDYKYSLGKMSLSSRCHWSHPSDHPLGFCFWWISACIFCKLFIMLCGNMSHEIAHKCCSKLCWRKLLYSNSQAENEAAEKQKTWKEKSSNRRRWLSQVLWQNMLCNSQWSLHRHKNTIVADYYTSLVNTSIGKKVSAQTV